MLFTLKCAHCMVTNVLQDRQYTLGARSFLMAEKALLTTNDLATILFDTEQRNDLRTVKYLWPFLSLLRSTFFQRKYARMHRFAYSGYEKSEKFSAEPPDPRTGRGSGTRGERRGEE
jgi:hypothetical protein